MWSPGAFASSVLLLRPNDGRGEEGLEEFCGEIDTWGH